MRIKVI